MNTRREYKTKKSASKRQLSRLCRLWSGVFLLYWLCGSSGVMAQDTDVRGVPWNGEPGKTESVKDIAERERKNGGKIPDAPRIPPRGRIPPRKDADSPNGSKPQVADIAMPDSGIAISADAPTVFALQSPQTVGTSFLGPAYADSSYVPPSAMGAVGPSQILVCLNGRIRLYSKDGTPDPVFNFTTDTFFASVANVVPGVVYTSDPRVVYDSLSQRWFVTMINTATPANRVLIAMSSGPTITSITNFTFWQFQQDLVGSTPNADTNAFADFPTLGVDANALYIGVNIFSNPADSSTFLSVTAFIVNKSDLVAATPKLTVTPFRRFLGDVSTGGMRSPIAATNMDPAATTGYYMGMTDQLNTVYMRRVQFTAPSTFILLGTGNAPFTVSSYDTLAVPAKNSNPQLDPMDRRIMNCQLINGRLYITYGTRLDATGAAVSTGDRMGMRFYEFDVTTTPPTIRQSATVFDSTASKRSYWVGSIGTSGQGHTVLVSSIAGPNDFAGLAYAGRLSSDALNTIGSPAIVAAGSAAYNVTAGPALQRWGDYTNVVVDPTDNMTMWSFQQYANAAGAWGVLVTQFKAPPPPLGNSLTASPASGAAGTTLNVTITGTSVSGSGFYDGGSRFNRLSATVNGGGVMVNSFTYTDPTHITLNVTILPGASATSRTVTVSNPDGQSVTTPAGIFQVTAPVITLTPSTATLPTGTTTQAYSQTITASGGTAPYTFSLSGSLPAGLTLASTSSTTAAISGTPTKSGTQTFTVQAVDASGFIGSTQYTINIQNLLTTTFSLVVNTRTYEPTPVGIFAGGTYTLNTTLTNTGAAITTPIYLQITALTKNGAGQNPQPNKLTNATTCSGVAGTPTCAGGAGDTQNIALSLGAGSPVGLPLVFGLSERRSFNFLFDVYTVLPGPAALSATESTKSDASGVFNVFKALQGLYDVPTKADDTAQPGVRVLLAQYQLQVADPGPTQPRGDADFNSDPLGNMPIVTGPGPQSRPAVAVDPLVPTHMAIAANDYATQTITVNTSLNGGLTWHGTTLARSVLNQTFAAAAAPALAFDSHGRLSVVYVLANPFNAVNAIVISESSDGVNFSPPVPISFHPASDGIIDSRPAIALRADGGRYVAWDSASTATLRYSIKIARSDEGGVFGPVTTVVEDGLVSSPALALSSKAVYVGWNDWGFNSNAAFDTGGRLMITSSPLGKLAFDAPQEIAKTSIGFARKITAMPDKGVNPNLHLAVDPKREDVYAVFADRGNGIDVFFARSRNRGKTWIVQTVNNDGTAADQFSPAIAVDGDGDISISFYDTRLSSTFETAHVFIARSNNGISFDNQRVTTAAANNSATNPLRDFMSNLGDQTAIAATNNDALVAWTDTRLDSEDIFASIVFDPNGAFVTGSGKISSPAGAYSADRTLAGPAEFGFNFKYKKGSSLPAGDTAFSFAVSKSSIKFKFRSTSYDWLNVAGPVAQFKGSGTVNGTGDYAFLVSISDGNQPGGDGIDKFRIKIVEKATGAIVYDNVPGAPDRLDIAAPIIGGKIQIADR